MESWVAVVAVTVIILVAASVIAPGAIAFLSEGRDAQAIGVQVQFMEHARAQLRALATQAVGSVVQLRALPQSKLSATAGGTIVVSFQSPLEDAAEFGGSGMTITHQNGVTFISFTLDDPAILLGAPAFGRMLQFSKTADGIVVSA